MKSGSYVVRIENLAEDVIVEVVGGIGSEEVAQLFGFCVAHLLEHGVDSEELKALVDGFKEEQNDRKADHGRNK